MVTKSILTPIMFLLLATATFLSAQDKRPAEKLIELPRLTKKTFQDQLVPMLAELRSESGDQLFILLYGPPSELKRMKKIFLDNMKFKCFDEGPRITIVDVGASKSKQGLVVWRKFADGAEPSI